METRASFLEGLTLAPGDVLAMDGMCGAGKTTLAQAISQSMDVDIIHLDDFFLPLDLRTPQRFAEPGGNVHYERFLDQVLTKIPLGVPFSYDKFDCSVLDYTHQIHLSNNRPIVVEGSYSLRPDFRPYYTKTLFLHIDQATQNARILQRNGAQGLAEFQTRWIPKENAYFQACDIANHAQFLVDGR